VPTYKDTAGNVRLDPAAVADKRLRVNNTQRILNMLTVKERHSSVPEARTASSVVSFDRDKSDPDYGKDVLGIMQQGNINRYRQYHLDTFGEYLTDEQGFEIVGQIVPSCLFDHRGYCKVRPETIDPKPNKFGTPPPKPLAH